MSVRDSVEPTQVESGTAAGTYYFFTCPHCGQFNLLNRKTSHTGMCRECHQLVPLVGIETKS